MFSVTPILDSLTENGQSWIDLDSGQTGGPFVRGQQGCLGALSSASRNGQAIRALIVSQAENASPIPNAITPRVRLPSMSLIVSLFTEFSNAALRVVPEPERLETHNWRISRRCMAGLSKMKERC